MYKSQESTLNHTKLDEWLDEPGMSMNYVIQVQIESLKYTQPN